MKRRVYVIGGCVLAMALGIASTSSAQGMKVSVLGGASFSMPKYDPSVEEAFGIDNAKGPGITGFVVGAQLRRALMSGATNGPDLLIQARIATGGLKFEVEEDDVKITNKIAITSFELPVMVSFPLGPKASVHGGVVFGFKVSDKQSLAFDAPGTADDFDDDLEGEDASNIKKNTVGIAVGAQFAASKKVHIGVQLHLPLTNIDDSAVDDTTFKSVKLGSLSVFVVIPIGG